MSVIGAGGSLGSALGGALLLAARNGVYGLAMSRRLDGSLGRRLLAAQLTIDETTAMAAAQPNRREQQIAFWLTGFALYSFWNLGTLIGALTGNAIDPRTYGLDAAFPAGFVAMVWPLLSDPRARWAAVIGGVVFVSTVSFLPVGVPILLSVVGVLVFAGLTAWDTQRLKTEYLYGAMDGETAERSSIIGALSLYLNFINLFTLLLQLLGQREE